LGKSLADYLHYLETDKKRDSLFVQKVLFERLFSPKKLQGIVASNRRLSCSIATPDGIHDVGGLSSGEQEVFGILAGLQELAPKSSVILYDTPEANLNGALERRLMKEVERICKDGNQIFIATHSYEMIDAAPMDSLYYVAPSAGSGRENQAKRVSDEEERIRLFESLGASVGLQLVSQTVLFLEGELSSDKSLLLAMLPELPAGVKLVPSGTVNHVMAVTSRSFANDSPVICQVHMLNESPLVPDLDRLEMMVSEETIAIPG
jgi:predicted ATPase